MSIRRSRTVYLFNFYFYDHAFNGTMALHFTVYSTTLRFLRISILHHTRSILKLSCYYFHDFMVLLYIPGVVLHLNNFTLVTSSFNLFSNKLLDANNPVQQSYYRRLKVNNEHFIHTYPGLLWHKYRIFCKDARRVFRKLLPAGHLSQRCSFYWPIVTWNKLVSCFIFYYTVCDLYAFWGMVTMCLRNFT